MDLIRGGGGGEVGYRRGSHSLTSGICISRNISDAGIDLCWEINKDRVTNEDCSSIPPPLRGVITRTDFFSPSIARLSVANIMMILRVCGHRRGITHGEVN